MVRVGGGYGLLRGIELGAATSPATVIGPLSDLINGEKQSGMGEETVMSLYLSAPSNQCFPSCLFPSQFLLLPPPPLAQLVPPPLRSLHWRPLFHLPGISYFSPLLFPLLAIGYWQWLAHGTFSLSSFIPFHAHH